MNSCATSGPRTPNQAMLASSSTGMMRLASKVNDPTTATTASSTAIRAQLAPSLGSPLLSQVMTSSGRPAMPPLSLIHCSYTSAAPGMFGYGGSCVSTGAVTMILIGSPEGRRTGGSGSPLPRTAPDRADGKRGDDRDADCTHALGAPDKQTWNLTCFPPPAAGPPARRCRRSAAARPWSTPSSVAARNADGSASRLSRH